MEFRGIGSREMSHRLWTRAGIRPSGDWLLQDQCEEGHDILRFARERGAYVVVGRMPVLFDKMPHEEMRILVEGDPAMRRPYIVMEADPKRFPKANHAAARALSDFLLSETVQRFLKTFGAERFGGIPLFHPVWPWSEGQ